MFLHPLLLAIGLAAAAIPLAVHWMTRPRPVRMPLSTIRLVSDALNQRRARHRLRDFLVLLWRCLAVALLAMAIARPLLDGDQQSGSDEQAERVKIVLVDASQSMGAIDGAATRFDAARAAAASELSYQPRMVANLLLASHDSGAVFDAPTANLRLLRDRLADVKVTAAALDPSRSLEEVTRQLSTLDTESSLELVVISDFQRSSWSRADFSVLPEQTKIRLVSVASDTTPPNLAIEQVRTSATPTAGKPLTILVDVANHSPETRTVTCQLELQSSGKQDGSTESGASFSTGPSTITRAVEGTIEAQSKSTLQMTVDWPAAGWQWGEVRLVDTGDALAADDTLPVAIGVRPESRVAIVTEADGETGNGAFFMQQLFSQHLSSEDDAVEGGSSLVVLTPDTLDTPAAQSSRLWIFTDVEAWDETVAPRVAAWLRRGRAVLYIARGPADANNLQALQTTLGSEMQPPVELIASLESDRRRELRIDSFDQRNAPFIALGDTLATTAVAWRIGGGSPTRTLDNAVVDAVAATLSDRSALLFFTDIGAGRLAVLNADLSASNLAYQAGFVPMMVETIGRLTDSDGALAGTTSGQPVVRDLPSDVHETDSLTIARVAESSDEEASAGKIQSQDGMLVWNWPAATTPGVYRVVDENDRTLWAEAVRSDLAEQDLRSLSQEVLQERVAGGRELQYQASGKQSGQADSLWVWATLAMLGCMIAEIGTLFLFKS